jgi:uncharacterized membrane protein YadS
MKASGLIFLLAAAVLLLPIANAPNTELVTESPQTVCGDSAVLSEPAPQGAAENDDTADTVKIIAAVVVIIIVIYFISHIADMGSQ